MNDEGMIKNGCCSHDSCLVSSFRGLRNGLFYGAKVRFVHSLVMTFLFKSDTLENKIKNILSLTYEHSKNLGIYVFIYKSVGCLLRKILKKNYNWISLLSGIIGSAVMWSSNTPVNSQIMLYLLSRNLMAITNILEPAKNLISDDKGFPIVSIICWGIVMFLFENYPKSLQQSLYSSMDFLYNESNSYKTWTDFVPFNIPDKLVEIIEKTFLKKS